MLTWEGAVTVNETDDAFPDPRFEIEIVRLLTSPAERYWTLDAKTRLTGDWLVETEKPRLWVVVWLVE